MAANRMPPSKICNGKTLISLKTFKFKYEVASFFTNQISTARQWGKGGNASAISTVKLKTGKRLLIDFYRKRYFISLLRRLMTISFLLVLFAASSTLAFSQSQSNRKGEILRKKRKTFFTQINALRIKEIQAVSWNRMRIQAETNNCSIRHTTESPSELFLSTKSAPPSESHKKSDQQEWKAIFMSLQLYKAAYGNVEVPMDFVVPDAAPWPEPAWGSKLGQKVISIREKELYVLNKPKRRMQLEKIGFDFNKQGDYTENIGITVNDVLDALTVYRVEIKPTGPLTIPAGFSVPDADPWPEKTRGLALEKSLKALTTKAFLKKNPAVEDRLKQIGFQTNKKLSANDKRFLALYSALERYKETYGDLVIPQPFVVPTDSSEWPEETWGLRLGARVNAIRTQGTFIKNNPDRRDMLDAIGFIWKPPEKDTRKRGRKTLDEIDEEEKKAMMEASSSTSPTPGISEHATAIEEKSDDERTDSFLSFFDFNDDDKGSDKNDSVMNESTWGLEAEIDSAESKTIAPSSKLKVHEDYEAPRTLGESLLAARRRALDSGIIVDTDTKRPTKRKREPEIPWFNDDFGGYFVFEDVVEALTLYKKKYGDFSNLTNEDFIIPVNDAPLHSFDDDFDNNASMNFDDIPNFNDTEKTPMFDSEIESEISRLEKGIIAQTLASADSNEVEWPEHLEGMKMSDIVKRINDGSLEVKHLPERKAKLDAIDYDWGDPKYFLDVPFEKAMCAMYAFYMVRGDMFVPPDYVMLDEDPWPKALAGYELGKAVKRIRELQNFFEAFHPEKVNLLRMIDFVWFPTLALPIDPDEGEMSAEMLLLSALGHPDYQQLDEFPMGLPDKIMEDGPFHDSDDPRQWWRQWHNWDYVADIWYSMGTKDRSVALLKNGYPRMAAEHRDKYGPGLFEQIDDFLNSIFNDIKELEGMIGQRDAENFVVATNQYNDLINQWPVMSHSERMEAPGLYLTNFTLYGREGGLPSILKVYTDTFEETQRERVDLSEHMSIIRDKLFGYLDELVDCTDMGDLELDILWRFRIKLYLSLALHDCFDTSMKKSTNDESIGVTNKQIVEVSDQLESEMSFPLPDEFDSEEVEDQDYESSVEDKVKI